jgi:uncharacterized membrane protein (UPF0136 family)
LELCRLEALPDDVINEILSHLDPQTLRAARLVNRQLRKLATSCIQLFVLTGPITLQQRRFVPDKCAIRARLDSLEDAVTPATARCLPSLQELHLCNTSGFHSETVSGRAALGLFLAATRLTSLVINDRAGPDANILADILSRCSALHTFRLRGCPRWKGRTLSLPTGLTHLQVLVLDFPALAFGSLPGISMWSGLRVLRGVPVESEAVLAHVATTLTALTDLGMVVGYARRQGSLAPLTLMSRLEVLGLHQVPQYDHQREYWWGLDLTPVASLTQLASLTVRGVGGRSIVPRLHNLSRLSFLDLGVQASWDDGQAPMLLGIDLGSLTHLGVSLPGLADRYVDDVIAALGRASQVESLRLGFHSSCVGRELADVLSGLARLTHLAFAGGQYLDPVSFPHVIPRLSGLHSLELSAIPVNRDVLPELARLSGLTRLHLWVNNNVSPQDARCLGKLTNLEDFKVNMRDRSNAIKGLVPCPEYPNHIYAKVFLDVQAARRKKGWQDLRLWKRPKVAGFPFFTIRWFLPGFEWDGQHESRLLRCR